MANQNDDVPDRDDFVHMHIGKAASKVDRANFVEGFLNDTAPQQDGTPAALIDFDAIDVAFADQEEAEAGASNTRIVSPLSVALATRAPTFTEMTARAFPPTWKTVRTSGHTTPGIGSARVVRTSYADIVSGGYPAASYKRSTDRYMPDGSTDAVNGGYWLLMEKAVRPEMLGAVGDGSTDDTVAVQAAFTYGAAEIAGVPTTLSPSRRQGGRDTCTARARSTALPEAQSLSPAR